MYRLPTLLSHSLYRQNPTYKTQNRNTRQNEKSKQTLNTNHAVRKPIHEFISSNYPSQKDSLGTILQSHLVFYQNELKRNQTSNASLT